MTKDNESQIFLLDVDGSANGVEIELTVDDINSILEKYKNNLFINYFIFQNKNYYPIKDLEYIEYLLIDFNNAMCEEPFWNFDYDDFYDRYKNNTEFTDGLKKIVRKKGGLDSIIELEDILSGDYKFFLTTAYIAYTLQPLMAELYRKYGV